MGTDAVILFVYLDSYLFVLSTSILQAGIGVNSNLYTCESPIPPVADKLTLEPRYSYVFSSTAPPKFPLTTVLLQGHDMVRPLAT